MKQLEISRLMDEYTDTEVFPEGGSAANPEAVKGWVLANVKAPAKKKQKPAKKKLLLAAALATVMVVLVGAGFPYIEHKLVGGTLSFEQTSNGRITAFVHNSELVKCEDDRLIFTANDGQRIDITDLIDQDTPYIYDGSDPGTGSTYYVVMGGTPESYGWFEWIQTPYAFDDGAYHFDEDGNPVSILFDFELVTSGDDRRSVFGYDCVCLDGDMDLPWLLAGAEQVGITFEEAVESVTVANDP
ncbi:MAG: hypothetical protein K2M42_00425 [Oscillospiraceae bacterium]|nr:hypothetical protein [Oscillospiraceae bacterium]